MQRWRAIEGGCSRPRRVSGPHAPRPGTHRKPFARGQRPKISGAAFAPRPIVGSNLIRDFEPPRLLFLLERNDNLEHPILHLCLGVFHISAVGKRNRAVKTALDALGAPEAFAFSSFRALVTPLALGT